MVREVSPLFEMVKIPGIVATSSGSKIMSGPKSTVLGVTVKNGVVET